MASRRSGRPSARSRVSSGTRWSRSSRCTPRTSRTDRGRMLRLITSRLATGIPTLLAVSLGVFAIVRCIPGDPARLLAGYFATDQIVEELRGRWHLDDPLPVQYAAYLGGVLHG